MNWKEFAKAISGGLTSGLTSLGVVILDGTITSQEWVGVVLSAIAGFGAVYFTTNATPPVDPAV